MFTDCTGPAPLRGSSDAVTAQIPDYIRQTAEETLLQAAIDSGCDTLYSEDLNAGQRFGSLLIVNPFK